MTISLLDAERYVHAGIQYRDGEYDCGSLAVQVQRELFGRDVGLPAVDQRSAGRAGQGRDLLRWRPELSEQTDTPETGDAVVLWATEGAGRRWHVGTAFVQDSTVWVLHIADEVQGVSLQRLADMQDQGMSLDGFYRWKTAAPPSMSLAISRHPMQQGAEVRHVAYGRTLLATLEAEGVTGNGWVVSIGGIDVPQHMWALTRVKHGTVIEARAVVRKQILAIVAIIVLSYFTFGLGGLAGGGFMGLTGVAGYVAAAAVFVGGSMLINKFLGPKAASMGDMASTQVPPTYSLQGGRNRARLWEPLSLVLGETKMIPDLANQPYTWVESDDQYLTMLYHAGINCGTVSQLKNGATDLSTYEDVTLRRYGFATGTADTPPILGTSVDTVPGGVLDAVTSPGPWRTATTSVNTARIEVDIQGTLTKLNEKGKAEAASATLEFQYRPTGTTNWLPFATGSQVVTNLGQKTLRRTFSMDVTPDQYEVRVRKLTIDPTSPTEQQQLQWTDMRSFQPDTADYGGQPRVELKVKASGQLNGALDELSWIATAAPMPIWTGSAWTTATTAGANGLSNPGAQILRLLRGIYRESDGKLLAGAGLADRRIDIGSLQAFMVRCAAMNFRFDHVVQERISLGDLLQAIAYAGLGTMTDHAGKIGVVWAAESQPTEGVINMVSMKARSFEVAYTLSKTADEYQAEFFDADSEWTWQSVRVKAPGIDVPQQSSSENIRGVTRRDHAAILARFSMGQSLYGRKTVSWEMDLEHLRYRRGAIVALSHDLTQWGYGGACRNIVITPNSFIVTVDEPVPPEVHTIRTLGLNVPGEQSMRVFPISSISPDGRDLTVSQAWPANATRPGELDVEAGDYRWVYDLKESPGYRVRILSIEPSDGMNGARITASPDSPELWNYIINGTYVPPPNNSLLAREAPVVSNLQVRRVRERIGDSWEHRLVATWEVRGRYASAQVWAGVVGAPLELVEGGGTVIGTSHAWRVPPDQTWNIEVRPFDELGRPGVKAGLYFSDPSVLVGAVQGLTVSVESTGMEARWLPPAVDWGVTRLRLGATYATGLQIFEGRTDRYNMGWLAADDYLLWAVHVNSADDLSPPAVFAFEVLPPAQPIVTASPEINEARLTWTPSRTTQPLRGYEVKVGNIYADAIIVTVVDSLGFVHTPPNAGTHLYWVTAIDLANNRSAPGYVQVTTLPGITQGIEELQEGLEDAFQGILDNANAIDVVEGALTIVNGQISVINGQLAEVTGAPDHDTGTAYSAGDIVKSGGKLYRARIAVPTGVAITNNTYWELIGDYASLGDAVVAHAVRLDDHDTRITLTEDGLVAEASSRDTLAAQVRGAYLGTDITQLSQGLVFNERQARAAADAANAKLVQGVRADLTALTAPGGVVAGHSTAISILTASVEDTEDGLVAVGDRLDVVEAGVNAVGSEALIIDPELSSGVSAWSGTGLTVFLASDSGVPLAAPAAKVVRAAVQASGVRTNTRKLRGSVNVGGDAVRVTPGEILDFSVWVYVEGTVSGRTALVVLHGPTDTPTTAAVLGTVASGGWKLLAGEFTVPAGSTFLSVGMRRNATAAEGFAWYASIQASRRSGSLANVSAAIVNEANTRATALQAEATARQTLLANITSASNDNLVLNPTYAPEGTRATDAITTYISAAGSPVATGAPAAVLLRRQTVTAGAAAQLAVPLIGGGFTQPVAVGDILDVSVWMHTAPVTAGSGQILVQTLTSASVASNALTLTYAGTGWRNLTGTFTVPAGAVAIRLFYSQGAGAAGFVAHYAGLDVRKRGATAAALSASVVATSNALATLDNKVSASYTLSVQAGNKIAGFRVGTDGATSDFVVLSDKFAWSYAVNGEIKYGLVTGLINGVASFGFSGNMYLDGTLQARMIGADQIRAVHIRTDEIEARHIKAGAITADKISVALSGNMIPNSTLVTTRGWLFYDGTGGQADLNNTGTDKPNADFHPVGGHALAILQSGETQAVMLWYVDIPVVAGTRYEVSARIAAHRCVAYVGVEWRNAAGTGFGAFGTPSFSGGGGNSLSAFTKRFEFGIAPAGATVARVILVKNATTPGQVNSWGWFTQPYFGVASNYQTIGSEYSPSGVGTRIGPEGIETNSLGAISPDLGLIVRGRMVSADGQMIVDMDNKSFYMLRNGRRIEITTAGGLYMGADSGVGPFLRYDINTGEMYLNGVFTAEAINAVNTINIAGQAVTTLASYSGGPNFSDGFPGLWITNFTFQRTFPTNGSGILVLVQVLGSTSFAGSDVTIRLRNTTTGAILCQWVQPYEEVGRFTAASFGAETTAAAGVNTYVLETTRTSDWFITFNLSVLTARR